MDRAGFHGAATPRVNGYRVKEVSDWLRAYIAAGASLPEAVWELNLILTYAITDVQHELAHELAREARRPKQPKRRQRKRK